MEDLLVIATTSLFAATVNGALGYGYSSITVPISLLVVSSRRLNPALVLIEVVVNIYALFLARRSVKKILPLVTPVAFGLLPGVAVGSLVLASIDPEWAKLVTYGALLPLILIQAGGVRWPIKRHKLVGVPFGTAIGTLYSMTTISGPPLALYFNNHGLSKDEFKAALAFVRTIEAVSTLCAYIALGILTEDSLSMVPVLAPGVIVGLPLGFYLIRKIDAELFRRVCMSFDAWLVAFGLARVMVNLSLLPPAYAYQTLTLTLLVDIVLLRRFFVTRRRHALGSLGDATRATPATASSRR